MIVKKKYRFRSGLFFPEKKNIKTESTWKNSVNNITNSTEFSRQTFEES